ncbi:MAG: hypothetical protein WAU23_01750 [Ferruginibacter sp.]
MRKTKMLCTHLGMVIIFFAGCRQQPVFSQKVVIYDLVKDFNAIADDKTDNYAAFVKAAEVISGAGGGILNIPKGKYFIASYKGIKGANIGDIVFRNCNNLSIIGNNSVIRVNGHFTRNRDYQLPGLSFNYAYNNTVCPFKLTNCKNVLLKDISLYGEVDKMKKEQGVVEGESFGVFISDDEPTDVSSRILLENVQAHHFASDGILIKSNGENIVLNNCNSSFNARQGLSVVKGSKIKVLHSVFDSTGKTGAYGWHPPGAGIDIENEFGAGKLNDVLISNCTLRGNTGFQVVTTLSSNKVVLDSCFIADASGGYSEALNGVGMYSLNSRLSNSILFAGIQVDLNDQVYKGPEIQEISKNIVYSGNRGIVSADYARPVNITDNIFIMLPKPKLDEYFPYIQNYNCVYNRNMVVVHADRLVNDANQVTALVQGAKEVKEDFWLVNGYTIPPEKQRTVYFLPATNGSKIVTDQFFGASDVVARYDYNKTHFLLPGQVNTILNNEIFSAYKQTTFNQGYLKQASEIRKKMAAIVAEAKSK